jgi:glyoxylase-like metal-dependent hydrolase (beta-lactamase superfamily II)
LVSIDENLPDFFFILGNNNGSYPNSNSLLIQTNDKSNEAILFDSGVGHDLVNQLLKDFKISKVFLSHWHEDHISGNHLLKRQNVEFFCHPLDSQVLRDLSKFQVLYDTKGSSVENFFQEMLVSMHLEDLTDSHDVHHNQEIEIEEALKIQVIHTPGHSAGHCCFYEPRNRLIFLADIDLSGLGPWYGCLDSNVDEFENSIKKLIQMDIKYAISGHKGPFIGKTEIRDQLDNYLEIIKLRDDKILDELSTIKPKSVKELVGKGIIYKKYTSMKEYLYIAENQMISKHANRLAEKGKINKTGTNLLLN